MQTNTASRLRSSEKSEAIDAFRTAAQDQAFYFYKGIGQPISRSSSNLAEFVQVLQSVDPTSVQFHVQRGDFERWFKSLGEQSLANQIAGLRGRNISGQELRTELSLAVGSRVNQLQKGQQEDQQGHQQGQQQRQSQGSSGNQGAGSGSRSGSTSSGVYPIASSRGEAISPDCFP